jgi:hypothetical protein
MRNSGPASPALFDDVVDPIQSEKADEDQVDSHCEAQSTGCDHEEHPRGQGNDRQ